MNSLEQQVFSSNEWGLVAMLHEGFMERLEEVVSLIEANQTEELSPLFENMRDILAELIVQFKGDNELGQKLRELYIFVNKLITDGFRNKNINVFMKARQIMDPLTSAFQELSNRQSPKSVSGYTYGKTDIQDSHISSFDSKR